MGGFLGGRQPPAEFDSHASPDCLVFEQPSSRARFSLKLVVASGRTLQLIEHVLARDHGASRDASPATASPRS
jgi:hypothetical protein